ncbi:DNA cytosine methyltransferase [Cellulosimicrobium cellulans]|uniref:DNA cytosine methyltransferase n=1 Tax=Cellulosimicrobium cellulans TaxID=1710 RepID=UPI0035D78B6A
MTTTTAAPRTLAFPDPSPTADPGALASLLFGSQRLADPTTGGEAVTMTDLFCGAGGSSTGAAGVPGVNIVIAANHWQLAIDVHNENHPNTDHAAADLHQEDPRFFPKTDILWASPECTKWSQANGSAPLPAIEEGLFEDPLSAEAATRSRLLMFDVLRFAEHHRYRAMVIENVVDIAVQEKYRMAWYEWRQQLRALGYKFRVVSLNSMHAQAYGMPAPQSRDRVYIVCWREGERAPDLDKILRPRAHCPKCDQLVRATQSWKNGKTVGRYRQTYVYTHTKCGTVVEPGWLPAAAAIDWSIPGERVGDRLADKTRARIAAGIARYWSPIHLEAAGNTYDAADPKHLNHGDPNAYYRAWSADEPLRTLHTNASKALAVPVEGRDGKDAFPLDLPMRTQTTRHETALAQAPFITEMYGTGTARPASHPAGTFTAGGNHHGLAQHPGDPFVMTNNHQNRAHSTDEPMPTATTATGGGHALITRHYGIPGGDAGRHTTPVDEAMRTLTANGGNMSLVTPAGGSWNDDARPTDEALRTLTSRDAYALVSPYYGTAREARPASDPVGTLTTVDRYALIQRMNSGGAEMTTPALEAMRTLTTSGHQALLQAGTPTGRPRVTPEDLKAAEAMVPDVLFRMFRPHEVASGMAFPVTYRWDVKDSKGRTPSNRDLVKMAGNAVTPPASRDLIAVVVESLTGELLLAA